jgi:ATP-dependent RNA helicase DeaD
VTVGSDNPARFEDFGLAEPLLHAVREAGYERPMPVQAACFRPAAEGRHLVVRSQTGSGKTAAFALPLLHRLDPALRRTQALVLAPTRELALQDWNEFERLGLYTGFGTVAIYGGTGFRDQLDRLAAGVQIVVGTPGRVLDHFRRGTLRLSDISVLVLDEADEMLSAGFYEDIRKVLDAAKSLRQVLLFSATLPPNLERLIGRHMPDPVRVDLSVDGVSVDRILNLVYPVEPGGSRLRSLVAVLEAEDPAAAIVFCNTRSDTEAVTAYLKRRGYDAAMLNSDLSQTDREAVLGRMRAGTQRLLVATDIAARGIDISFLPCVINYEPPVDPELYVHRTGRTGRVDRSGRAVTLVSGFDRHAMQRVQWRFGIRPEERDTPTREETLKMLADRRIREMKERIDAGAVIPDEFRTIAREILTDPDSEALVSLLVDRFLAEPPPERVAAPVRREDGAGGGRHRRRGGRPNEQRGT